MLQRPKFRSYFSSTGNDVSQRESAPAAGAALPIELGKLRHSAWWQRPFHARHLRLHAARRAARPSAVLSLSRTVPVTRESPPPYLLVTLLGVTVARV
eukprot:767435-Hanusia_phi.AAC.6